MANNITNVWKLMGIDPATGKGTYKNRMGLGNAITRDNGIPLDLSGLHATYNDAVVYAATSSIAYVDQPIAAEGVLYLITEASQGKVKIGNYRDSITGKLVESAEKEYDVYLKRVGIVPTGDDASIVVNGEGLVKIFAFDGAQTGTVPVKDENGKLVWKTLEEIGAGDGNDNTTYEFAVCDDKIGIVITPLFNGQPIMEGEGEEAKQVKYHLDLDVYTKEQTDSKIAEAIGKIEFPAPPDLSPYATKEYVDGEVDRLEKAIDDVEAKIPSLESYATIEYVDGEVDKLEEAIAEKADADDLTALTNRVNAFLDGAGAEGALDSLQELIAYIDEHDGADLTEMIATIEGIENKLAGIDTTVVAYVTAAIDALKIGDYAKASDLTSLATRVKTLEDVDNATQAELNAYKEEVTQAIATAKQEAIDAIPSLEPYATKEALEAHIEAAEGLYATKDELTAHANTADGKYATKDELTAHEATAATTYATKDELITHTNTADGKYATKEYVGTFTTGEDAYKDIATVVGYINKKAEETLAAAQGGSSETAASVKLQLDNYKTENDAKVLKNSNDISTLAGQLATTNTNVTGNTEAIAAINTNIATNVTPKIAALEGADVEIKKTLGEHTEAIATLNTTTIPALQQLIVNEATTRGNAIDAINNKIGTVAADKTIVDMIADAQAAATYDDTAIRALITANTTAIGNETARATGAEEALAARIKAYEDVKDTYATKTALEAEVTRATAAETANANAIAALDATLKAALENDADGLDSIKELASWINTHGTEAADMSKAITKNAEDITALTARVGANETAIAGHTTDIAAVLAKANANETAIAAINNADTGILAVAKAYADTKASEVALTAGTGISIVDKKINVTTVTTDQIVQGTETLILNGGSAEVPTTNA